MEVLQEIRMYSLDEMAEMVNIPRSTLKRWAQEGRIQAVKAGRRWKISAEGIRHFQKYGTEVPGKEDS